jgi:SAM-dependent methyltransferase
MADSKSPEEIRKYVKKHYAEIAAGARRGCCCGDQSGEKLTSLKLGYSSDELSHLPEGSILGLGCGNPVGLASIKTGETILDLGSGGGIDCFLAAAKVGEKGKVIGVDITPEMIQKARENARNNIYNNVEFRLGQIEKLPVENDSIDCVISNCVINLAPDKGLVYAEIYRVLKPGGRIAISDMVVTQPLTEAVKNDLASFAACISGAAAVEELKRILSNTGFLEISILPHNNEADWISNYQNEGIPIISANISAIKPLGASKKA